MRGQTWGKSVSPEIQRDENGSLFYRAPAGITVDESFNLAEQFLSAVVADELAKLDASLKEDNDPTITPPPDRGENWLRVPKAEVMQQQALRLSTWRLGMIANMERASRREKP